MPQLAHTTNARLGAASSDLLVFPGQPGWHEARRAWNLAVDQRPALVALAERADDVAAVVRYAAESGLQVAPQGTGHNASALGGDDLGGEHPVGAQAVAARAPAQAAAERVADDADVGRRAGERGEAVLGSRLDELDPDRAGGDTGNAPLRIDRDAAQLMQLDEHGAGEVAERSGVVPVP